MKIRKSHIALLLCALLCLSCSHRALHEAQSVVAEADSLRTVGQPYTDSTQLAQAYTTLKHWQNLRPDDYARACYYYGRLLRSAEHYPEAMTCFINATHSRSTDYHILGRAYSNMGSLCHLADELSLSYDMYDRSSQMFLRAGDSLLYYYALNEMAYELAEQGLAEESFSILAMIETDSVDDAVGIETLKTKAELYKNIQQYDSAIFYANRFQILANDNILSTMIKAQAFSRLGMKDSAIIYANIILSDSCAPYQHRFNALYVLASNDSTLNQDEIRAIASEREDIRYYEYEPTKDRLVTAIQLLKLDLQHKYDRRWLYVLVGFMMLVGGGLGLLYTYRRSRRIKKDADGMRATLEKKCEAIVQLSDKQQTSTIYWNDYSALCYFMDVNMNGIVNKLLQQNPNLTEQNIRLSITILIGFSYSRSADLLRLSKASISKSKQILAAKLGTDIKSLRSYLMDMACQNA